MKKLIGAVAIILLLIGCSSEPEQPKEQAKGATKPKVDTSKPDHLLEQVQSAPTYGDRMLKTYQGAKDVKKEIDQQTAEQKDVQNEADQ